MKKVFVLAALMVEEHFRDRKTQHTDVSLLIQGFSKCSPQTVFICENINLSNYRHLSGRENVLIVQSKEAANC